MKCLYRSQVSRTEQARTRAGTMRLQSIENAPARLLDKALAAAINIASSFPASLAALFFAAPVGHPGDRESQQGCRVGDGHADYYV